MGNLKQKINIAIDGPAGAGKSTVARNVAGKLGYIYVDTGAMYRAVTWKAIEQGIAHDDTQAIVNMAKQLDIRLIPQSDGQQVLVNGMDVSEAIRSSQVNARVSSVAQIAEIRQLLVIKQKQIALAKGVVMDGRDIATKVLPDAEVKVYLTASVEERASRRFNEIKQKQPSITYDQLKRDIAERDRLDQNRAISPLKVAEDAYVLDSTNLPIPKVVEIILDLSRTKMAGEK